MTDHYSWTTPTARKPHHCYLCTRVVLPGEPYRRCASIADGSVETFKYCEHCYRISETWCRHVGEYEYDPYMTIEWLEDEYPALLAGLQAHWRYPDGELYPWPFQHHCIDCGRRIYFGAIWCPACDLHPIERIGRQLRGLVIS